MSTTVGGTVVLSSLQGRDCGRGGWLRGQTRAIRLPLKNSARASLDVITIINFISSMIVIL